MLEGENSRVASEGLFGEMVIFTWGELSRTFQTYSKPSVLSSMSKLSFAVRVIVFFRVLYDTERAIAPGVSKSFSLFGNVSEITFNCTNGGISSIFRLFAIVMSFNELYAGCGRLEKE